MYYCNFLYQWNIILTINKKTQTYSPQQQSWVHSFFVHCTRWSNTTLMVATRSGQVSLQDMIWFFFICLFLVEKRIYNGLMDHLLISISNIVHFYHQEIIEYFYWIQIHSEHRNQAESRLGKSVCVLFFCLTDMNMLMKPANGQYIPQCFINGYSKTYII